MREDVNRGEMRLNGENKRKKTKIIKTKRDEIDKAKI